jgi:hypothetical protein
MVKDLFTARIVIENTGLSEGFNIEKERGSLKNIHFLLFFLFFFEYRKYKNSQSLFTPWVLK